MVELTLFGVEWRVEQSVVDEMMGLVQHSACLDARTAMAEYVTALCEIDDPRVQLMGSIDD